MLSTVCDTELFILCWSATQYPLTHETVTFLRNEINSARHIFWYQIVIEIGLFC